MTFGVAAYNQMMPLDMLMKMTEDALKFGKQSGKNKVLVANEMLNITQQITKVYVSFEAPNRLCMIKVDSLQ